MLLTPHGDVAVNRLWVGDLVTVRDNGPLPLLWSVTRRLDADDLRANPRLRPTEIAVGKQTVPDDVKTVYTIEDERKAHIKEACFHETNDCRGKLDANLMTSVNTALGLRQATLALREYDPRWAELFRSEASLIFGALAGIPHEIEHIGSTAVPGLSAKPILDIALCSSAETQIAAALVELGYIDRGWRSGRLFIRLCDGDVRTHNLHFYRPNDPDYADQIRFRNVLRSDTKRRAEYAALKQGLVESLGDGGRAEYAEGKTDFVTSVLRSGS